MSYDERAEKELQTQDNNQNGLSETADTVVSEQSTQKVLVHSENKEQNDLSTTITSDQSNEVKIDSHKEILSAEELARRAKAMNFLGLTQPEEETKVGESSANTGNSVASHNSQNGLNKVLAGFNQIDSETNKQTVISATSTSQNGLIEQAVSQKAEPSTNGKVLTDPTELKDDLLNKNKVDFKENLKKQTEDERYQEITKNMDPNDKAKYDKTMNMIKTSKEETQKTLDRLDNTIKSIKETQEGLQETSQKFQNLQDGWSNVFAKLNETLNESLAGAFGGQMGPYSGYGNNIEDHFSSIPEICDVDTVSDLIVEKSNIVVYSGSEISTGSGIPNFKTEHQFWTLKNGQTKIEVSELLTKKFFEEHPEEVWRWHHQLKKMVENSAPNNAHYNLADMHNQCKDLSLGFTLVTQNIDSFHVDAYTRSESKNKTNYFEETKGEPMMEDENSETYGFCPEVFEIHGNINYMRCEKNCCKKLFPSPIGCPDSFIPQCPECHGRARPHTKFNDEEYDEDFYKTDTVQERVTYCDCLIIVGAELENNIASTIVSHAMSSGTLIVEIGTAPRLEIGDVKQLIGFPEEIVPLLCRSIHDRITLRR